MAADVDPMNMVGRMVTDPEEGVSYEVHHLTLDGVSGDPETVHLQKPGAGSFVELDVSEFLDKFGDQLPE